MNRCTIDEAIGHAMMNPGVVVAFRNERGEYCTIVAPAGWPERCAA